MDIKVENIDGSSSLEIKEENTQDNNVINVNDTINVNNFVSDVEGTKIENVINLVKIDDTDFIQGDELKTFNSKNRKKAERKKRSRIRKKEKTINISARNGPLEYPSNIGDIDNFELSGGFERFKMPESEDITDNESNSKLPAYLPKKAVAAAILEDDDDDDIKPISKKKWKLMNRMSIGELKVRVKDPGLVESYDNCSRDPLFLLELKETRNTVPVPVHWCHVGRYLQSKRGFCKPPFQLPEYLASTGIMEIRPTQGIQEKTLKTKMKEKMRPKVGMCDLDYQKLHDAFFKNQTKPLYTTLGDVYYQGKEVKFESKEMRPGHLSNKLREALGIPPGKDGDRIPPPFLIHQQRYGPPPCWPKLKIPGLNAPLPPGASYGYHRDGWGKPPVDENNVPIYGNAFDNAFVKFADKYMWEEEEEDDGKLWGEPDSSDEEDDDDKDSVISDELVRRKREPSDEGEISDNETPIPPAPTSNVVISASATTSSRRPPPLAIDRMDMDEQLINQKPERNSRKIDIQPKKVEGKDLYKVLKQRKNEIAEDLLGSQKVYELDNFESSNSVSKRKFEIIKSEEKVKSKKHKFKF